MPSTVSRRRPASTNARLLQRVAGTQQARQPVRQRIDDGDFQSQPPVVDHDGKDVALAQ